MVHLLLGRAALFGAISVTLGQSSPKVASAAFTAPPLFQCRISKSPDSFVWNPKPQRNTFGVSAGRSDWKLGSLDYGPTPTDYYSDSRTTSPYYQDNASGDYYEDDPYDNYDEPPRYYDPYDGEFDDFYSENEDADLLDSPQEERTRWRRSEREGHPSRVTTASSGSYRIEDDRDMWFPEQEYDDPYNIPLDYDDYYRGNEGSRSFGRSQDDKTVWRPPVREDHPSRVTTTARGTVPTRGNLPSDNTFTWDESDRPSNDNSGTIGRVVRGTPRRNRDMYYEE